MWNLKTLPAKAQVHLPEDTEDYTQCEFKKARGEDAIQVIFHDDNDWQPIPVYFCYGRRIVHRRRGYGRTPWEVFTPEDSFSSVCLATLKDAVQHVKDNYPTENGGK